MKRLIQAGLMLVSAFALTNCAEELTAPVQENNDVVTDMTTDVNTSEGIPYEVIAEIAETKTAYNQTSGSTYWVPGDKINVLTSPTTGQSSYNKHGVFSYVGNGKFTGKLSTGLANQNDWYYIYGSSSVTTATDKITATVTIGAPEDKDYIQTQQGAANLAGDYYPMYGIKRNIPNTQTPKVAMSHLYSTIALEICNVGDELDNANAPINIKTLEFVAPEAIVGEFDVNVLGDFYLNSIGQTYAPVSGKSSNIANIDVWDADAETDYISIPSGTSKKIYFVVKPFDASNKKITIKINGSTKTVTMPANTKFDAGKVVTLKIDLTHKKGSKITDALEKTYSYWFKDYNFVDFYDYSTPTTKNINGEVVSLYTIGSKEKGGKIKLEGQPLDLVYLLPASFYAASYDNGQAIMRITKAAIEVAGYDIDLTYDMLASMAPINLINFTGLIPLTPSVNDASSTGNVIIMDEEPYNKALSVEAINNLLAKFDTYPNDPDDNRVPTLAGLQKGFNNQWDDESEATFDIIFTKAQYSLQNNNNDMVAKLKTVLAMGYKTVCGLMTVTTRAKVELSTLDKGTSINLGTPEKPNIVTATDGRAVVWGLDLNDN